MAYGGQRDDQPSDEAARWLNGSLFGSAGGRGLSKWRILGTLIGLAGVAALTGLAFSNVIVNVISLAIFLSCQYLALRLYQRHRRQLP